MKVSISSFQILHFPKNENFEMLCFTYLKAMTKTTPRTMPSKKMNLYFTLKFRSCLRLFSASIA